MRTQTQGLGAKGELRSSDLISHQMSPRPSVSPRRSQMLLKPPGMGTTTFLSNLLQRSPLHLPTWPLLCMTLYTARCSSKEAPASRRCGFATSHGGASQRAADTSRQGLATYSRKQNWPHQGVCRYPDEFHALEPWLQFPEWYQISFLASLDTRSSKQPCYFPHLILSSSGFATQQAQDHYSGVMRDGPEQSFNHIQAFPLLNDCLTLSSFLTSRPCSWLQSS